METPSSEDKYVDGIRSMSIPSVIAVLLGMLLPVFSINYYVNTIVHWSLSYSIWVVAGLTGTLIFTIFPKKKQIQNVAVRLLFNCFSWGGIAVYSFIMLNYHFPGGAETQIKLAIQELNYAPIRKYTCGNYYAVVTIGKLHQDINFSCGAQPEGAKFILVTMKKGFWGLNIVTDTEPLLK